LRKYWKKKVKETRKNQFKKKSDNFFPARQNNQGSKTTMKVVHQKDDKTRQLF